MLGLWNNETLMLQSEGDNKNLCRSRTRVRQRQGEIFTLKNMTHNIPRKDTTYALANNERKCYLK